MASARAVRAGSRAAARKEVVPRSQGTSGQPPGCTNEPDQSTLAEVSVSEAVLCAPAATLRELEGNPVADSERDKSLI